MFFPVALRPALSLLPPQFLLFMIIRYIKLLILSIFFSSYNAKYLIRKKVMKITRIVKTTWMNFLNVFPCPSGYRIVETQISIIKR